MSPNQTAQTILQQLGGNRFIAMTNAKLSNDSRSLCIQTARATVTVIELMDDDTYKVKTGKRASMKQLEAGQPVIAWKHEATGIYDDMLQEEFTRQTGLYTHF